VSPDKSSIFGSVTFLVIEDVAYFSTGEKWEAEADGEDEEPNIGPFCG
jgi:hypothetical protein